MRIRLSQSDRMLARQALEHYLAEVEKAQKALQKVLVATMAADVAQGYGERVAKELANLPAERPTLDLPDAHLRSVLADALVVFSVKLSKTREAELDLGLGESAEHTAQRLGQAAQIMARARGQTSLLDDEADDDGLDDDTTVTIAAGGHEATMSGREFSRRARAVAEGH